MKVTITTIAQAAGVSRGTVDKVIHNRKGVSDEVRQKVKSIIAEYDYQPNQIARALTVGRKPVRLAAIIQEGDAHISHIYEGMLKAQSDYTDYGMQLEVIRPASNHASEFRAAWEQLEADPPDGIVSIGVGDEQIIRYIDAYSEKNVPVVLCDSDIKGSSRLCYVGENHLKSGQIAGALLAKVVGKKGKVAVIGGSNSIDGHFARLEGFRKMLSLRYPEIEIVTTAESRDDNTAAHEATLRVLRDFPDLDGIFVRTAIVTGVARAVVSSHKTEQIHIVGYNFGQDISTLLNLELVDFTIGISSFQQGYQAVETLFQYLQNNVTPPGGINETPLEIFITEDLDVFLHS